MKKLNLISIEEPNSPVTEAYRTLRTNIQFSSFDKKIQTVVVTSSGPGEGKSTTSANLAVVMAKAGHRTILIDCDQRKPTVHKLFNLSNEMGISDLLIGSGEFGHLVKDTEVENLEVLTSGTKPPNPSELLSSKKMQDFIESLKENYEYIIIDTPPIIPVTDAQLIASYSDGTLLVASSGEVDKDALVKAKELLMKVKANIVGVVLNKLDISERMAYGYYYNYYYGSKKKAKEKKSITTANRKSNKVAL